MTNGVQGGGMMARRIFIVIVVMVAYLMSVAGGIALVYYAPGWVIAGVLASLLFYMIRDLWRSTE
jgi:membrane protein YdbS with pleckstrin-like domain